MVAAPGGIAVDADFVYYGAKGSPPDYFDGVLYKIPKSGGVPTPLATGLNHIIKIRADGNRVYWANGGHVDLPDGSVASVSNNGGPITIIASGLLRPYRAADAEYVYWLDGALAGAATLRRAKKSGK